MKVSSLVCCAATLATIAPHAALAQQRPVTLCLVVEAREDDPNNLVQYAGRDAKQLGEALSSQSLPNGTPIVAVLLIGLRPQAENRVIEQRGCKYVANLQRHESVDVQQEDIDPSGQLQIAALGDRDMIELTLRRADSKKVIARMAKPPLTFWGRSHTVKFDPFPPFVKEIKKKISQAEK